MATITDIKRRIQELSPAGFQEFCDSLIYKNGYSGIHGYGMKAGTSKTTKGQPDSYFKSDNGKYIFVAYTMQELNIFTKLKEDIDNCLDSNKTGIQISDIEEIICCHTSSNLSAGDDKKLYEHCKKIGIALTIWGIDELANQVQSKYRSMAKDFLGIEIYTNQILSIEEFIKISDANGMSAPLNTQFLYREEEKKNIIKALKTQSVIIVTGKSGVGKTRLVLEAIKDFNYNNEYRLLCIKSNNLCIYDDLVAEMEKPGKYLFFVDDANELAQLNLILDYINNSQEGYIVKIIVTVRDYVKEKVIITINDYTIPKIIEITNFSDEELSEFLKINLKINNAEYLEQIIYIAKGNPRIAYMAGRLAIEKHDISAIENVSELYDMFYKKIIDNTIGENRSLCFVAGVLSIIHSINFDKISIIKELLDNYDISITDFKEKVYNLYDLEVVEIYLNQVATLTDQSFSNYMIYYVFFKKKIISLSNVLEIGYKNFRNGVLQTINTILNLFYSKETEDFCKKEILIVWDKLKYENNSNFEDFVLDFHIFRPEEGFIMAQNKINNIKKSNFEIYDIDFSQEQYYIDKSILKLLTGYKNDIEHLTIVLDLLLEYASKKKENMISAFNFLKENYGINYLDLKYNYYTQNYISNYLMEKILNDNEIIDVFTFQWVTYSLRFSFQSTELNKNNNIIFYNLKLIYSKGLEEYRNLCWKILISFSNNEKLREKIILFLYDYSNSINENSDTNIIKKDFKYVDELLLKIKNNSIFFLKTVNKIIYYAENMGINYNVKLNKLFSKNEWKLYELLKYDYSVSYLKNEEYKSDREAKIIKYSKTLNFSNIKSLVKNVNIILSENKIDNDQYFINDGLKIIVKQFDENFLIEFLDAFIKYGSKIYLQPSIVIEPFINNNTYIKIYEKIKNNNFPQKDEWLFMFFYLLPKSKINDSILKKFMTFIRNDLDKNIIEANYRSLRILDKFLDIEPNIYPIICSIIFEKRHYNGFMLNIYFTLLFNHLVYSPKEVLKLFENDTHILKEIYFYMIEHNYNFTDYNGIFLSEFISVNEIWLQEFTNVFWEYCGKDIKHTYSRTASLWKTKNYIKYFDYIFYNFPEDKLFNFIRVNVFEKLLINKDKNIIIEKNIQEWINHIIVENSSNKLIYTIFDFVCELDADIKRKAIKTFLDNNSDFEIFNKLNILSKKLICFGSLVPKYQEQIEFLESLFPMVSSLDLIKHKSRIKLEIEYLRKKIEMEEIREIDSNLYM